MSCNPKQQGQKQKMTPGKTFQEAKSKKILGKKKKKWNPKYCGKKYMVKKSKYIRSKKVKYLLVNVME